jgi:hypothetical protein
MVGSVTATQVAAWLRLLQAVCLKKQMASVKKG